jgi:hypothetical protein
LTFFAREREQLDREGDTPVIVACDAAARELTVGTNASDTGRGDDALGEMNGLVERQSRTQVHALTSSVDGAVQRAVAARGGGGVDVAS